MEVGDTPKVTLFVRSTTGILSCGCDLDLCNVLPLTAHPGTDLKETECVSRWSEKVCTELEPV